VSNIPFTVEPPEEVPLWRDGGVIEVVKATLKVVLLLAIVGIVFLVVVKPLLYPPPVTVPDEAQQLDEQFDEKMKMELAMLSPQAREKRRLEMELDKERRRMELEERQMAEDEARVRAEEDRRREEEDRKRMEEDKQREYEELLAYAKDYVSRDAAVVAAVFKDWLREQKPGA
jgi:flagellar biosynthesis/type III secretory pathway M-ring protein FliF/YscJ